MDEKQFWQIVDDSVRISGDDRDAQIEALTLRLRGLSGEEIVSFESWYDRLRQVAYRWDLWAAAYLIKGGCSDDGFEYFRAWLISRGSQVYRAALANPDTLASVVDLESDDYEFEAFMYLSREVLEEATGTEAAYDTGAELGGDPAGIRWDFDDDVEMCRHLPRLWSRVSEADV